MRSGHRYSEISWSSKISRRPSSFHHGILCGAGPSVKGVCSAFQVKSSKENVPEMSPVCFLFAAAVQSSLLLYLQFMLLLQVSDSFSRFCSILSTSTSSLILTDHLRKEKPGIANPQDRYANCSRDWIEFGSKCFYFSEDMRNYTSCQTFCMAKGAQLARFDSEDELDVLKKHKNDSAYWIGLLKNSSEHSWRWTDNTEYNNLYVFRPLFLCFDVLRERKKGYGFGQ
ncbi:hypothetical protein STEG23_028503, partial [Scotinomys teguina]